MPSSDRAPTFAAEVVVDATASPEEVRACEAAFRAYGVDAKVTRASGREDAGGDAQWTVSARMPLAAWRDALFAGAGEDAWQLIHRFAQAVYHARRRSSELPGLFVVQDDRSGARVMLDPWSPQEAFHELLHLDLEKYSGTTLNWNEGRWGQA